MENALTTRRELLLAPLLAALPAAFLAEAAAAAPAPGLTIVRLPDQLAFM
jgi:hypothetical protein